MAQRESELKIALRDIAAGTAGGICQTLVGYPLDTIKVRMQTVPLGVNASQVGAIAVFSKTLREEGVRGLFKGMSSPITGSALINAAIFLAYGQSKVIISKFKDDPSAPLTLPELALAGAMAGAAQCTVTAPVELIKGRLQIQYATPEGMRPRYTGSWDCLKQTLQHGGVRGLYRGMAITICSEVPSYLAMFGVYETTRALLTPPGKSVDDLPLWGTLLAGGLGGMGCWLACYPQDLIKSRIQTQPDDRPRLYKLHRWIPDGGAIDCARQVMAAGGWRGLFVGFVPCILRAFPCNAACFFGYQKTMDLLR